MLYYKINKWYICVEKVRYIDNSIELDSYVGQEGKRWWLGLVELHDNITVTEFIDIEITDEQISRLEEINQLNIGDGHSTVLADYVIRNKFPEEVNHILKDLQNKKSISSIEEESLFSMIATIENYENNLKLEEENVNTMVAIVELYEMLGGI